VTRGVSRSGVAQLLIGIGAAVVIPSWLYGIGYPSHPGGALFAGNDFTGTGGIRPGVVIPVGALAALTLLGLSQLRLARPFWNVWSGPLQTSIAAVISLVALGMLLRHVDLALTWGGFCTGSVCKISFISLWGPVLLDCLGTALMLVGSSWAWYMLRAPRSPDRGDSTARPLAR